MSPVPQYVSLLVSHYLYSSIDGFAIGKVIRSENPQVKAGTHVYGNLGECLVHDFIKKPAFTVRYCVAEYQNYNILKKLGDLRVIDNKEKLPWSTYLGVLGMPGKGVSILKWSLLIGTIGQTAYMAWKEYSEAKKVYVYRSNSTL